MREINRLSDKGIRKLREPGWYNDGGGLHLQIAPGGSKQWIFRYTLRGRARVMGLGSLKTFTLAEARDRAKAARQLLIDKIDPLEHRRAEQDQRLEGTYPDNSVSLMDQASRDAVDAAELSSRLDSIANEIDTNVTYSHAFALVVLDEVNALRTNAGLSTRTAAQLKTAVRNKLDTIS